MPLLVQKYLNYLIVVKSKSELTALEYASDLRTFYRFIMIRYNLCDKDTPFDEINISGLSNDIIINITLDDAYAFLAYCRQKRNNSDNAIARKVVSIKRFYRYLEVNNILKENRIAFLEAPQTKKALPKYLTLEQSVKLLNSIDGKFKERDYCILTIFLNCGLRLSELVGINISHIRDDNTLVVKGKGNKERTVYLNEACLKAISSYLAVRPVDGVKDRDALFISSQKRRISKQGVQKIVERSLEKSGLSGLGFSTHKLRHTSATLMYQYGGVDPLQLKEILGHENLSTTEIYTHIKNEQLKQAVDSNPLNDPSNLKEP
ncbi:MAG: tyrosine recombinase XerC [Clostridiaceae bacterium]|nr:tyrosine recombinase XerC [Clostridiaceae bacterium]